MMNNYEAWHVRDQVLVEVAVDSYYNTLVRQLKELAEKHRKNKPRESFTLKITLAQVAALRNLNKDIIDFKKSIVVTNEIRFKGGI